MFWTNFVKFCAEKGEAPSVVATKCGVKSTGTVSGWKKGAIPREAIINKLADYLEVSADELKGDETKKEPTSISESELTPAELSIIELLRQIPAERQAVVRLAVEISLRSQGVLESPSERPPQDR